MTLITTLALGIALLVGAPYLAHRLRRQRADQKPFAPARLVAPTPPKARRRSRLEDRSLFALRALSIVALALLGASPLVTCSRLAISRGGASVAVAIVIDDSMSMRAPLDGQTRLARAKKGARDVLASLREGDAAAIVFAGAPARVGLAATTDISSARTIVDNLTESDRATDLDGAIAIAKTLVGALPQIDRRVVVLSDLADGRPDAPRLGEGGTIPVWIAMPELKARADEADCALLGADRAGPRGRVRFACSSPSAAANREVSIKDGERVVASAKLPETALGEASVTITADESRDLVAVLEGRDAIASDDRAPVVVESGPAAIAVVGDREGEAVSTGGAPIVEQALGALHLEMAVRPIPQPPDRKEDTAPFAAILIDDPPGFTPEQRHALGAYVERGGVVVLALGRRAAAAPLGANFAPFLNHVLAWERVTVSGADVATAAPLFGESAASLTDLGTKGRVRLETQDLAGYEPLLRWTDGVPLVARAVRDRGEVWVTTLPFSVEVSDFALRPGFLAFLDAVVASAKQRSAPRRGDVGLAWAFAGARNVLADGPNGKVETLRDEGTLRIVPSVVGAYAIDVDGTKERRVASPIAREVDFRPRAVAESATSSSQGGGTAIVDASWVIALVLLALVAAELVVRTVTRPRGEEASA